MRKVVLDSDVYLSAINFGGIPLRILYMGRDDEIEINISDPILNEVLRVQAEKFKATPESLVMAKRLIKSCTKQVDSAITLDVVPNDPEDNRIVECAVASGSETIVTGDKRHLLRLGSYQGIQMITPKDFLAKVLQK